MTPALTTAAQAGLVSCEACQLLSHPVNATEPGYCRRCGEELEFRKHASIETTWALIVAAAICYIPANALPVLNTTSLGETEADTILGGVAFLYTSGSWPLALIVLVASVMIPLGKLVALAYLLITVQRGSIKNGRDRTRLYRLVEFIGRWSMLDVFVDTFTVALVQLQPLMSVAPGPGRAVLRGRRRADDAGGRDLRPPPDLGFRPSAERPMADEPDLKALPQATVVRKKRMRFSVVWIIPILAAVVAIGIAVQRFLSEGPTINIIFNEAQGIEAGKTFIKYKDVRIGLVTAVELSEGTAGWWSGPRSPSTRPGLMVSDAKFWVVEPRISLSGISGLNTLLSGNYIEFQAGCLSEPEVRSLGLEAPPVVSGPARQADSC